MGRPLNKPLYTTPNVGIVVIGESANSETPKGKTWSHVA